MLVGLGVSTTASVGTLVGTAVGSGVDGVQLPTLNVPNMSINPKRYRFLFIPCFPLLLLVVNVLTHK